MGRGQLRRPEAAPGGVSAVEGGQPRPMLCDVLVFRRLCEEDVARRRLANDQRRGVWPPTLSVWPTSEGVPNVQGVIVPRDADVPDALSDGAAEGHDRLRSGLSGEKADASGCRGV